MKICVISEAKSSHTQRWCTGLVNAGCKVDLISSSEGNIPSVAIHNVPIYSANPLYQILNTIRIKKLIKKINPELVHVFGLFSLFSLGNMLAINNSKKAIISVWGSDIVLTTARETIKEKIIKKYLLNHGNVILATSKFLAEKTSKYLDRNINIRVLHWGVDLNTFYPYIGSKKNNFLTIGFAKRLHLISGPDLLLKSFCYARERLDKRLILKIAGNGPLISMLKKEAIKMGVSDSIDWLGWINDSKDLAKFYRSLDIFIMPSRKESYGVAAVEALASGLPVIASNIGGIPEILDDGFTGLLVEPENIEGFGKAIIDLATNDCLRVTMGTNARTKALEKFNFENTIDKTLKIYNKIIA